MTVEEFIEIAQLSRPGMTVKLDWFSDSQINECKRYVISYQQNNGKDIEKLKNELNDQHVYNIANTIKIIEITREY